MRLAQIARKVGMTPSDIKRFLESEFDLNIGKEPNYKLGEDQISAVLEKFPIPEPPKVEVAVKAVPSEPEEVIEEESIDALDHAVEEINTIDAETEVTVVEEEIETEIQEDEIVSNEVATAEEEDIVPVTEPESAIGSTDSTEAVEINYDEVGQEDEGAFTEVPVDRNAELIKAPTVKLDGLKVLGKIELPEKKVPEPEVAPEDIEQNEADAIASLDAAMQSQVQDIKIGKIDQPKSKAVKENIIDSEEAYSEYKDQRGIYHFSSQQKANRAKALTQLEFKRKVKAEKEKKKRHYETVMQAKKEKESNKARIIKQKKTEITKTKKAKKEQKEAPKGLWSRFVSWLND